MSTIKIGKREYPYFLSVNRVEEFLKNSEKQDTDDSVLKSENTIYTIKQCVINERQSQPALQRLWLHLTNPLPKVDDWGDIIAPIEIKKFSESILQQLAADLKGQDSEEKQESEKKPSPPKS